MREKMRGAQPKVLRWARERMGLTLEQVAATLKKEVDDILAWERGEDYPTYSQLEKLARQCYKRPIALFFFPEPPEEDDQRTDFRLLPEQELSRLEPSTLFEIRRMKARRESLIELTGGRNPARYLIFRELAIKGNRVSPELPAMIRDFLGIDSETRAAWRSTDEALKAWRDAIEAHGVYVFKGSLEQRSVSGFCLTDRELPIIFINNSTAKTRQIFTLFHELAHLLFAENGMTLVDDSYIDTLPLDDRRLEIACNRIAAEVLVPAEEFEDMVGAWDGSEEGIGDIAAEFKVSREVIARKLLDRGALSEEDYRVLAARWNRAWLNRRKGGGGNYYATQIAYLGKGFSSLAFSRYYDGYCTLPELAEHLGVKAEQVENLEPMVIASM